MRPLKILVTADPLLPVPPQFYGGIERVIALLIEGLSQRGHSVTLTARGDSTVGCEVVPYPEVGKWGRLGTFAIAALVAREVVRRRPDVVLSFGRLAYLLPILPLGIPKVMSYQREVTRRTVAAANSLAHGTLSFTGCSRHLIRTVQGIGRWDVIYNAVPVGTFSFSDTVAGDAPLVFLGRIEHIKGTHLAIEAARRSGRRLIIAGNIPDDAAHLDYFTRQVEPWVDGDRVKYVGPVDDAAKSTLLSGAAALLMPVLWDEPFGIVMAEALACGTPVIGLSRGAVPEVVEEGLTGFHCQDIEGLVAAIGRVGVLSRRACRASAERRFSQPSLVDAYEAVCRARLSAATQSASLGRAAH